MKKISDLYGYWNLGICKVNIDFEKWKIFR